MQLLPYQAPEVEALVLLPQESMLQTSNFGNPGAPGNGFGGGGGIIDYPDF